MNEKDFVKEIESMGLQYWTADELLYRGDSNAGTGVCAGLNDPEVPSDALEQMVELAYLLEIIRDEFGTPLRLSSGFRNKAYNECIGGSSGSYHMKGQAADLVPLQGESASRLYATILVIRDRGVFAGGVGSYSSFSHVDIRGHNADW